MLRIQGIAAQLSEDCKRASFGANIIVRGGGHETGDNIACEDEALLLLDYEAALADAGFVVVAVARGGKAIEVLRSADSEVAGVVTDIRFCELPNGWSVARVAREIYPDIPVVYGTGHGALEWPSRGVANSILLEKPFALAQLVTAVSQLLNEPVLLSVAPDPKPRTSTDYSQSVLAQMDNSWLLGRRSKHFAQAVVVPDAPLIKLY
ncbi:response regulator [Sinorhizobium meliloti]|uniref:response regulator n=1 Tax=Rhizobium meliloti TaxID=382 RepID=UPI001F456F61|nr:response regulator [Sinorhizobium meliloti]